MVSSPTQNANAKVHEWLMKSPDPPRHSKNRTIASSPKLNLKYTPPSMIYKPASENSSIDKQKRNTAVNNRNWQREDSIKLHDKDKTHEKLQVGVEEDDVGVSSSNHSSSSILEDAVILTVCAVHCLTTVVLVCVMCGLLIVAKAGYRLGLRRNA